MAAYKVKYEKSFPGRKMSPVTRTATQQAQNAEQARTLFRQQHRDSSQEKYEILEVKKV